MTILLAWICVFLLAVLGVAGLWLIIYGLFLENPESTKKYWTEVIIGGLFANVSGIGMAVIIAIIT